MMSRRTVLKGLGTTLALPWLEAMGPLRCWAADAPVPQRAPNRLAWVYIPNGAHMPDWTPKEVGADYELPYILKPLEAYKQDMTVLSGLAADKARAHGDGGGDHARAMSAFLTGAQPHKTDGTDIRVGISADQVAAGRIGHLTRLASLEIGADPTNMAGSCDTGYSCVYNSNLSWASATTPMPKMCNPRLIFERLFGSGSSAEQLQRNRTRRSILDVVLADSKDLQVGLSTHDRRKLDEYFTAVRDIESRIDRAEKLPPAPTPDYPHPQDIPASYEEHLRILCDLVVLAFQTDTTRISTLVFANESSNRTYPFVGVRDAHHELSHHQRNAAKQMKIREINLFHVKQFAYFLEKLRTTKEGDGTLLDHSTIVYGGAIADGDRHNHDNLPILLAGKACGTLKPGRHIQFEKETPINNLWLSMLDRVDSRVESLGDSTGRIAELG
jgi:hypothetical protein